MGTGGCFHQEEMPNPLFHGHRHLPVGRRPSLVLLFSGPVSTTPALFISAFLGSVLGIMTTS